MEPAEKKIKLEDLPGKSILDLNDDCLEEIFSYFSLQELVELEEVCPRFRNVAEEYFYKKQKVLKINGELHNRTQIAEMAERMGPYVSTLEIHGFYIDADVLKPLWIHFNSLEHLHIWNKNIMTHLELMKDILKKLKSAKFFNCGLTDEIGDYLKTAPELDNLSLEDNRKITGNFLPDLKHQLKEINVVNCHNIIQGPYFGEFCRKNLKLESLAICLITTIPDSLNANLAELTNLTKLILLNPRLMPTSNIVPHFPKLTHLELSNDRYFHLEDNIILNRFLDDVANMDCLEYLHIDEDAINMNYASNFKVYNGILPKFTKLKVLKLSSYYKGEFADSHLLSISMECRRTIEHLEIRESVKITDKGLLELLKDCPNIRNLDLRSCNKITDDLIHKLLPICNQRPHTLEIFVQWTRMTDYIRRFLEEWNKNQKIKFHCNSYFHNTMDSDDSDDFYEDDSDN